MTTSFKLFWESYQSTPEATMQEAPTEGRPLTLIPAGRSATNPTRLLSRPQMEHALTHLRENFDLVLVDAPPSLAGGDTWLLAQQADYCACLWCAPASPRAAAWPPHWRSWKVLTWGWP